MEDHRRLTSYVPVRFPPELIVAVRLLALEDGQSVSSWIRTAVAHELERRTVPA
jgi:predicted HicB family RNase H-like nuclease